MLNANCIECGELYEAFIMPDGNSAAGRCPQCREKFLVSSSTESGKKSFSTPRKKLEPWAVRQTCSCGQEYDARHYINLYSKEADASGGLCENCRARMRAEEEVKEEAAKLRTINDKRESWRRSCGIPVIYQQERFETWKTGRPGTVDKAYTICQEYAEKYPLLTPQGYQSLILTSPRIWGLGKTHLACAIAHHVLDRWQGQGRCPVCMVDEPSLMLRIRATYNRTIYTGEGAPPRQETEELILKQLTWVPLLILDDVGKNDVADPKFTQRILFQIINGRYNNGKLPIVITANATEYEFKEHIGGENEATLDRLLENVRFIEITGKSYRRKS